MSKPLFNVKVALLVASGFNQPDMVAVQRALLDAGANVRIVSPDNGLVNGWEGASWGHNFAVDSHLSKALGADFGVLVVPGGQRSADKLKLTAHTKRFVSSFFAANKPVVVMNEGVSALTVAETIQGRTVNGPEALADFAMQYGAIWSDDFPCVDGNLISGECTDETRAEFVTEMVEFVVAAVNVKMAQAA
ncbi:MAG: DJ-1/PfpI family protein [Alphaproteobacteria bacterium]|nr:DJ-1/PfpI family protein [Alphaproteobacteria bacterium]